MIVVDRRQEPARTSLAANDYKYRNHQEMKQWSHMGGVHSRTNKCPSHCADRERGMESGHDRAAEQLLDRRALDVLGNVPLTRTEPENEQTGADHQRPDFRSERNHC